MELQRVKGVYFIGIGGSGMSGIARVLLARGVKVSGSDAKDSAVTRSLRREGAQVHVGHDAAHLGDVERVIYSAAIALDNPELLEAQRRGVPLVRRDVALGELMADAVGIAVAGTNGKTTTTGMVASIFLHAGLDPTVLIGGDLPQIGGNARVGGGPHLISEACEAFGSFHALCPRLAIVTNVEADHLDHYGTLQGVIAGFQKFVAAIPPDGWAVLNAEDPHTPALMSSLQCGIVLFGAEGISPRRHGDTEKYTEGTLPDLNFSVPFSVSPCLRGEIVPGPQSAIRNLLTGSAVRADVPEPRFVASWNGETLGEIRLAVPGLHNVRNALAALGVALAAGVPFEAAREGLAAFTGTGRRFETLGEVGGVQVIDDYAHHPSKVQAALMTARDVLRRPLTAVFQPHLYSRTRDLMEQFADSFKAADRVIITDIYPAREAPIPGVDAEHLVAAIRARDPGREVHYLPRKEEVAPWLLKRVCRGDVVIVLGAGDVRQVGETLVELLKAPGS